MRMRRAVTTMTTSTTKDNNNKKSFLIWIFPVARRRHHGEIRRRRNHMMLRKSYAFVESSQRQGDLMSEQNCVTQTTSLQRRGDKKVTEISWTLYGMINVAMKVAPNDWKSIAIHFGLLNLFTLNKVAFK